MHSHSSLKARTSSHDSRLPDVLMPSSPVSAMGSNNGAQWRTHMRTGLHVSALQRLTDLGTADTTAHASCLLARCPPTASAIGFICVWIAPGSSIHAHFATLRMHRDRQHKRATRTERTRTFSHTNSCSPAARLLLPLPLAIGVVAAISTATAICTPPLLTVSSHATPSPRAPPTSKLTRTRSPLMLPACCSHAAALAIGHWCRGRDLDATACLLRASSGLAPPHGPPSPPAHPPTSTLPLTHAPSPPGCCPHTAYALVAAPHCVRRP